MKPIPSLRVVMLVGASTALVSCTTPSLTSVCDTDQDGRLSRSEVEVLLVDTIHKNEDANRDGKVTAAEWQAVNPNDDASLFSARDLNGDGAVTLEEARSHARTNGTFDKVIADLDGDGDGYVSGPDLEAFMKKHTLDSSGTSSTK